MSTFYRIEYNSYDLGWATHGEEESLADALQEIEWMKKGYDEGDIKFRIYLVSEYLAHEEEK